MQTVGLLVGTLPVLALPAARLRQSKATILAPVTAHKPSPLNVGDSLEVGQTIRTLPGGNAEILFNNGTRVSLRAGTTLQIVAMPDGDATSDKPLVLQVEGDGGEIFVRAQGPTEVRTTAATAAVRGTQFLMRLDSQLQTTLVVTEGRVNFANPQGGFELAAYQSSTAKQGEKPTPPTTVDTSGLLSWVFEVADLPLPLDLGGDAALDQAFARLQAGHPDEALTQLQESKSPVAPTFRALAYLQQGNASSALQEARVGLRNTPTSVTARAVLSLALLFNNQASIARREAQQALASDPFSPLALLALGRAELARGNAEEARQALQQAATLAPDYELFQVALGDIESRFDRLPRAEAAFARALVLVPDDPAALAGMGTVRAHQGRFEESRQLLEKAATQAPRNGAVQSQLADFLVVRGELDAALQLGERLTSPATPGGNGVYFDLGSDSAENGVLFIRLSEAALFRQKLESALVFATRAVEVLPDSALAHYQLGRVYLEGGRTVQAQNQFRLATAIDPDLARSRYALGIVTRLTGTSQAAVSPTGSVAGAEEAGPQSSISQLDALSAGLPDQVQASLQDPTVARSATRSFGDFQLFGSVGKSGLRQGGFSALRTSKDERSLLGASASTFHDPGERDFSATEFDEYGLTLGHKRASSPSGVWLLLSDIAGRVGQNIGTEDSEFTSFNINIHQRVALGGFNITGRKTRTLGLVGVRQVKYDSPIQQDDEVDASSQFHSDSPRFELRHDIRFPRNLLSIGASYGRRSELERDQYEYQNPETPDSQETNQQKVTQTSFYIRNRSKVGSGLVFSAELKRFQLRAETAHRTRDENGEGAENDTSDTTKASRTAATLVVEQRLNRNSSLRFRWSQKIGALSDLELTAPVDTFPLFDYRTFAPALLSRGEISNLEWNQSLGKAGFLSVGTFLQKSDSNPTDFVYTTSLKYQDVSVRGTLFSLEGQLNRQTTFYFRGRHQKARGTLVEESSGDSRRTFFPGPPDNQIELGVQYLNSQGYFIQPSLVYFGPRRLFVNAFDEGTEDAFYLGSVRIGKRWGLRAVVWAELANAFDANYTTGSDLIRQVGTPRRVRFGTSLRF